MPSLTKGVGIVSNIKYTGTDLEKNFNNGLGHPQWDRVVRHQLGYDAKDSARAVAELNTEGRVGLIVTVGGLTTAVAALNYSPNLTKPFVSLIGDTIPEFPGTIKDWFFGGMNLENFRRNPDRISRLADRGFQPGQICLLCNPKSATTPYETREWGGGRIYYAENLAQIQDAFTLFQRDGTLGAMIISSDGFFQNSKTRLRKRPINPVRLCAIHCKYIRRADVRCPAVGADGTGRCLLRHTFTSVRRRLWSSVVGRNRHLTP